MNELELINALKQGNEQAFNELVLLYKNLIFNTSLGIIQNLEEAEDVTQEVFIQVYKSVKSFNGESKLSTWIYKIATTKSIDVLRKQKAKKRFGLFKNILGITDANELEVTTFEHPGILIQNKEKATVLFKALNKLPENQKTAFVLIKTEGLNYNEVAEILNTSVKGVEGLMHRAKENLRKLLEDYYKK